MAPSSVLTSGPYVSYTQGPGTRFRIKTGQCGVELVQRLTRALVVK